MSSGQHALGPRGRRRQDLHHGRHRHEDEAGRVDQKPMYVVPNHMLEQFAREFQQLYPNARLLVATKEDLTRERRKFLTAKIASGDWDGIIIDPQQLRADWPVARLPGEVPARADQGIRAVALRRPPRRHRRRGSRNIIKTIEKQKAAREERLKDLLAAGRRRTTAWSSTSSASITSSSTRRITSRTWRRRPRWTASPASRPAAPSAPSTST